MHYYRKVYNVELLYAHRYSKRKISLTVHQQIFLSFPQIYKLKQALLTNHYFVSGFHFKRTQNMKQLCKGALIYNN